MFLVCSILFGMFVTTAVFAYRLSDENYDLQHKALLYQEEIVDLKCKLDIMNTKFIEVQKMSDSFPEDYTHGVWCESCQSSRIFHMYSSDGGRFPIAVCNRANICKHHILKEEYKDAEN